MGSCEEAVGPGEGDRDEEFESDEDFDSGFEAGAGFVSGFETGGPGEDFDPVFDAGAVLDPGFGFSSTFFNNPGSNLLSIRTRSAAHTNLPEG